MGTSKRDGFYKRGRYWWTRDPATKRRTSTGCTDFEAARRWRAARERIAADPAHAAASTSRLGDWVSRWLGMKAATARPATLSVARTKLGHWIRLLGPDALLAELDAPAFDGYVTARRAEGVTDHTISKEVTHMLAVLKLAKRGRCYPGDLETLRPPDLHAGYVPRKRALTRPELAALLSELEPARGALVAVCVALGCRLSEALRLLPTDLGPGRVLIRGTKTEGSFRELPVLSLYQPLLEQARPYLPLQPWGNVQRDLAAACARAGIPKASPNDLRRTHSTLLIEAGVDRDVVRRLLGHTTTAMVDRIYGQPRPEALGALAEERLLQAAPLAEVQERHNQTDADTNSAPAPVAQGIEQRFPKPIQGQERTSEKARLGGKHAGLASANAGEPPRIRGGAGTNRTHAGAAPDDSAYPAGAWSLALAMGDVLARRSA